MSVSPISTRPAVGSSRPAAIRRLVVLPHPDGPRRAKKEPWGTVRSRSSTATNSPNFLVIPSKRRSPLVSATHHLVELALERLALLGGHGLELVTFGHGGLVEEDVGTVHGRLVELGDLVL